MIPYYLDSPFILPGVAAHQRCEQEEHMFSQLGRYEIIGC